MSYTISGTLFFADVDPERFDGVVRTMFTLFQIVTLDEWFTDAAARNVWLLAYVVSFMILETFICLNLFIAVVVMTLDKPRDSDRDSRALAIFGARREEAASLLRLMHNRSSSFVKLSNAGRKKAASEAMAALEVDFELDALEFAAAERQMFSGGFRP